jgi:acyl CoA:acetate/3-ketoacid CoA transferase
MTPRKATNYRSTAALQPLLHDPVGLETLLDGLLHGALVAANGNNTECVGQD